MMAGETLGGHYRAAPAACYPTRNKARSGLGESLRGLGRRLAERGRNAGVANISRHVCTSPSAYHDLAHSPQCPYRLPPCLFETGAAHG